MAALVQTQLTWPDGLGGGNHKSTSIDRCLLLWKICESQSINIEQYEATVAPATIIAGLEKTIGVLIGELQKEFKAR